jgi:hypothetical protein
MAQVESSMQIQISVIIVNFNSRELLARAVGAVLSSGMSIEVIVVDNDSSDSSLRRLRLEYGLDSRVRILRNRRNLGFARACNRGIRYATGEYLLFLNPDCMVEVDTIASMIARLDRYPQVGLAGCLVRNPDGSEQVGSRRDVPTPWRSAVSVFHLDRLFPNNRRFRSFSHAGEPLPTRPQFVEAISGAFMLARRAALEQVGVFDKRYFLHCEDLDLCMRFPQAGWKILFVPDVEVLHYHGACSKATPIVVLWHKHRGMVRFYNKFFRDRYSLILMALVISTVWVRFMMLAGFEVLKRAVAWPRKLAPTKTVVR